MNKNRQSGKAAFWQSILLLILLATCLAQTHAQTDTIQTDVPALKDVYAHDFTIGCLLSYKYVGFPTDPYVPGQSAVITPNGGYLIQFHMNCMSPGNNMKPQYTVDIAASAAAYTAAAAGAERDSVEVHPIVRFNGDMIAQLDWAQRQGFTFRGHTLVWHSQTPTELFYSGYSTSNPRLSRALMIERMGNYIHEVIRLIHEGWPGLLSAIDVVNEAVNDDGTDRTGSEWYATFGDNSYIMTAFELTRQATIDYGETQIKLYYNDYNTSIASKADGIVRVCRPIFRAGYLDGIGMQEHDAMTFPTAEQWIASYSKFDTICTEMSVTELDVNPGGTPTPAILATQANQYGMLFKCFVERSYQSGRGKIINVSKDGLNDQYAFVANASLWDSHNQCKPAFFAAVNVGMQYNTLDSLIAVADTFQQANYTSGSWFVFSTVRSTARIARDRNYSSILSADTGLGEAIASLQSAMDGLVVVGVEDKQTPSLSFELRQNFPNPFNPTTQITYVLPQSGHISLKVYDLLGEEVASLFEGSQDAGIHTVKFDGTGLTSGVYLYRLQAGTFVETRKLMLFK